MWVNVVIPVKNGERFIGDAIASALGQPGVKRVVVVDDGSTDESAEIAARIGDERVTLIRSAGRGVSAARNLGFAEVERLSPARETERSWVMFLDADDRLVPGATRKLLDGVQDDCVAVYGNYERIDASGRRIGRRSLLLRRGKPSGEILRDLLAGNFIVNGGVMIVRAAAGQVAGVVPESLAAGLCAETGLVALAIADAPHSDAGLVWRRSGAVAPVRRFVQTALDVSGDDDQRAVG